MSQVENEVRSRQTEQPAQDTLRTGCGFYWAPGLGLSLRVPVFSSSLGESCDRGEQLSSALELAINVSLNLDGLLFVPATLQSRTDPIRGRRSQTYNAPKNPAVKRPPSTLDVPISSGKKSNSESKDKARWKFATKPPPTPWLYTLHPTHPPRLLGMSGAEYWTPASIFGTSCASVRMTMTIIKNTRNRTPFFI